MFPIASTFVIPGGNNLIHVCVTRVVQRDTNAEGNKSKIMTLKLDSLILYFQPETENGLVNLQDLTQLKKAIINAFSKEISSLRKEIFKALDSPKKGKS